MATETDRIVDRAIASIQPIFDAQEQGLALKRDALIRNLAEQARERERMQEREDAIFMHGLDLKQREELKKMDLAWLREKYGLKSEAEAEEAMRIAQGVASISDEVDSLQAELIATQDELASTDPDKEELYQELANRVSILTAELESKSKLRNEIMSDNPSVISAVKGIVADTRETRRKEADAKLKADTEEKAVKEKEAKTQEDKIADLVLTPTQKNIKKTTTDLGSRTEKIKEVIKALQPLGEAKIKARDAEKGILGRGLSAIQGSVMGALGDGDLRNIRALLGEETLAGLPGGQIGPIVGQATDPTYGLDSFRTNEENIVRQAQAQDQFLEAIRSLAPTLRESNPDIGGTLDALYNIPGPVQLNNK